MAKVSTNFKSYNIDLRLFCGEGIFAHMKGSIDLCEVTLSYIYWRHLQCTGTLSEQLLVLFFNRTKVMLIISKLYLKNVAGWRNYR
jgi:hypothetical protein